MLKVQKQNVLETLAKTKGLVSPAARILGVSRGTLYNYIQADPEIKQAVYDSRETLIDMAEAKLAELVANGETTAIIFTLKTIGKHRGYIEKTETDHFIKEMPQLPPIVLQAPTEHESNDND